MDNLKNIAERSIVEIKVGQSTPNMATNTKVAEDSFGMVFCHVFKHQMKSVILLLHLILFEVLSHYIIWTFLSSEWHKTVHCF